MKTKWHLYILWSVLSLGLLSCAADTYESKSALRRKKTFKLGSPKSKSDAIKLSTTGERKSSQRLPASTSLVSQLSSQTSPVTPLYTRPGKPEAKIQSDFAYLQDVSVTCSTSDFVVRVKPAFYGLGADAAELKLGSSCKSNGVLRPYGDLLFTYPLTACDSQREVLSPRVLFVPTVALLLLIFNSQYVTLPDSCLTVIWSTNSCSIMSQRQNASQAERIGSMSRLNVVIKGWTCLLAVFNLACVKVWTITYNLQNLHPAQEPSCVPAGCAAHLANCCCA